MYKKTIYFILFLVCVFQYTHPCAITNGLEKWRRLGDNITTYSKTKYFSQKFNLPFFLSPFPYCEQFHLHTTETILTEEIQKKFSKIVLINKVEDIIINPPEPTLFVCHFLSPAPSMYAYCREDLNFEKEIKTLLAPLEFIEPLPKPENVITVAVHVRKGGGYDGPLASLQEYGPDKPIKGIYLYKKNIPSSCIDIWPLQCAPGQIYIDETKEMLFKKNNFSDYVWPLKFPPDQYYIDHIKTLAQMLPEKNLLIYLFTDDPNPEDIVKRYTHALQNYPRIIFSYRNTGNRHDKNVLQDLFHMAQCDCILGALSSFASAAQLLGNHSIIIFPLHALTMPDKIFINKIGIITVENPLNPPLRKVNFKEFAHSSHSK